METEMRTDNPCSGFMSLLPTHSKAAISILQGFSSTTKTTQVQQPKKSVGFKILGYSFVNFFFFFFLAQNDYA